MGLDYFIRRDCPAQQTLGESGFLAQMQRRRQLAMFRPGALLVHDGKPLDVVIPPEGIQMTTRGPSGTTTTRLQAGDVATQDAELAPFEPACADCPANRTHEPFGCYGYVSYPIAAETEVWLLERVRAGAIDAAIATTTLRELGITGERSAELRERRGVFFAADTPQGIVWNLSDGKELVVTTDLVCDLLLFRAPGNMGLMPMLCAILGLCPADHGIRQHVREPQEIVRHADLERLAPATSQQRAITAYVDALVHAARIGFTVHTDG